MRGTKTLRVSRNRKVCNVVCIKRSRPALRCHFYCCCFISSFSICVAGATSCTFVYANWNIEIKWTFAVFFAASQMLKDHRTAKILLFHRQMLANKCPAKPPVTHTHSFAHWWIERRAKHNTKKMIEFNLDQRNENSFISSNRSL